jgi:anaerobic ribonucleoside-triphosphate reductase activating protein
VSSDGSPSASGELTWIVDPATGALVVEGVDQEQVAALAGDLLPPPQPLYCARPLVTAALPAATSARGGSAADTGDEPTLRLARVYHGSVVEGPGRRSVVQFQGCVLRCPGCVVPETHSLTAGGRLGVAQVVAALLDPAGEPRDGITVLGGEPFLQPGGLLALVRALKLRGLHVVVYSGYTLEALARRPEPEVRQVLDLTDLLVDGPFVARLAAGAGEWRGSRNQRLIANPGAAAARLAAGGAGPYRPTDGRADHEQSVAASVRLSRQRVQPAAAKQTHPDWR